ncbi:MAG TPA: ABC transporter permease, partial [Anaerolineales bacterium]
MTKLFAIIWKDARLRFSGVSELLFFIILPIVFTFLLAGGTPSPDDDNRIPLVVVDQANTEVSHQIIAELERSSAVRPEVLDLDRAQSQFDSRRAATLLILPAGLDLQAIQDGRAHVDFRQQPNNLEANVARQAIQSAVRRVSAAVNAAQAAVDAAEAQGAFQSEADRQAYFEEALVLAHELQDSAPERMSAVVGATPDRVEYDPRANSSAGQLITWVFIPLLGISALFAYERQQGTLRRILTTPTSRSTYLLGTVAGQVIMALVQMLLLVFFGIFVMKLAWGREPIALLILLTAAALAASAIGTAMGTFIKSEGQATGLSIMTGMVMALMGGCWYPLELFPPVVQSAVKILPTTWAMQGMLDLVLRGRGLADILP